MTHFQIRPTIHELKTITEFLKNFPIDKNTLIFTEKYFYEIFFKERELPCQYIFQDDHGLGEPTDLIVDKILDSLQELKFDQLIGVGGGTILDIAKLLVVKNATSTAEIFEDRIPLVRDKALILIPTTCGTGSEVTCVSVVHMTAQNTKIGKRIEASFADHAVLISEFLTDIPEKVFLYSSLDALVHAMEIYVAPTSNPYNEVFCEKAVILLLDHYKKILQEGLEARSTYMEEFLRASNFAGIALSNTTCGAVHALAMHFGAAHHVIHGESTTRFLMPVFNKYAELAPQNKLAELAAIIGQSLEVTSDIEGTFIALDKFIGQLAPKKALRDYGVKKENISLYVDQVIATQQRLLINNFIELSKSDLVSIYENAYEE